ncbi:acyl-CoA dehydrogenase C-terminal domain-containing protein [Alkalilimnicola ehrlichii]|uniref:acyl-CoA dehydrogenase C-terminal domain-containing protein n=1 Tax=Alkalilimnicola ehrlichii TaxID=351052 RepID=UPI001C6EBD08|nr:acyl-CoA dehydrogenase C-terminal domain-containing protein [Alkalilimnicola ehrlichii]
MDKAKADATCAPLATKLAEAAEILQAVTRDLQQQVAADPDRGLANASTYLDVFGRVLVGWIWLRQALVASHALEAGASGEDAEFYRGKVHTAGYFMEWELAPVEAMARLLSAGNGAAFEMENAWF